MRKGKTKSGFEFEIAEETLESWELLETINEVEDEPLKVVKLINLLLGTEQKKALIKHLGGKPSIFEMNAAITEIFNACKSDETIKN